MPCVLHGINSNMYKPTHLRQGPLQACQHAAEQRQQEAEHGERFLVVVFLSGEQQRHPCAHQQNHHHQRDSKLLPANTRAP